VTTLPLAHVARGPGEAVGLLFVSVTAVFGVTAFILFDSSRERPRLRTVAIVAAALAAVTLVLAYVSHLSSRGGGRRTVPGRRLDSRFSPRSPQRTFGGTRLWCPSSFG
jgi:ABC-type Fe3+ transport system permease subunit